MCFTQKNNSSVPMPSNLYAILFVQIMQKLSLQLSKLCKNYHCLKHNQLPLSNSVGRWYVVAIIWGTSDGYAISNLLFFKTYLHSLLTLQTILMYMTYNLPTPPISTLVFRSREPTPTILDSSGGTNQHIPVQNFTALVIYNHCLIYVGTNL